MQPILKIDLTSGEIGEFTIPPAWEQTFWAGLHWQRACSMTG